VIPGGLGVVPDDFRTVACDGVRVQIIRRFVTVSLALTMAVRLHLSPRSGSLAVTNAQEPTRPEAVLEAFHRAVAHGDRLAAFALLADTAVVEIDFAVMDASLGRAAVNAVRLQGHSDIGRLLHSARGIWALRTFSVISTGGDTIEWVGMPLSEDTDEEVGEREWHGAAVIRNGLIYFYKAHLDPVNMPATALAAPPTPPARGQTTSSSASRPSEPLQQPLLQRRPLAARPLASGETATIWPATLLGFASPPAPYASFRRSMPEGIERT
jgi:hypothetical protein